VHHVGNSSMVVGIRVTAENVKTHTVKHTNTSYFTMVAKGDDDKPVTVPPLILENMNQLKKFVDVIKKKRVKSEASAAINRAQSSFTLEEDYHLLKGQRCETKMPTHENFSGLFSETKDSE
jgi:acyl-CoA hydrolase